MGWESPLKIELFQDFHGVETVGAHLEPSISKGPLNATAAPLAKNPENASTPEKQHANTTMKCVPERDRHTTLAQLPMSIGNCFMIWITNPGLRSVDQAPTSTIVSATPDSAIDEECSRRSQG
jgi:hypothetical protein